jgi:hypothetical protein
MNFRHMIPKSGAEAPQTMRVDARLLGALGTLTLKDRARDARVLAEEKDRRQAVQPVPPAQARRKTGTDRPSNAVKKGRSSHDVA